MSWLPPVVIGEPQDEPLTIAEAKAQCRIAADDTQFDTELAIYVAAARQHVEAYTGTKLISQQVLLQCSSFQDLCDLPIAPILSIDSIKYLDTAGAEQTLATSVYEGVLTGLAPAIRLKINQSWPQVRPVSDSIRVTVTAGFGTDVLDVPAPVRHAMLLMIESWNADREVGELPNGATALLTNFRKF